MADPANNLDLLSPEEQLRLLEGIWDRLSQHPASLPRSAAQGAESDRRMDEPEVVLASAARDPGRVFLCASGDRVHPAEAWAPPEVGVAGMATAAEPARARGTP